MRGILDKLIYNDEYKTIDDNLTDSNVGARKNRNIRDNIFVINAISNSVIKGKEEPVDIQIYDVEKCFDALWLQDCINDLFEAGLQNDKLPLLLLENLNAQVAVKTPNGISRRTSIKNIIMQGSVWGSLMCTTSMDKLAQTVYENEDLVYWYKGVVAVPPICMVDDILAVQNCSKKSVKINAVTNAFIELKKLKFSQSKCGKVHIGKQSTVCPQLKIHGEAMKESNKEKYLGDQISSSGKIKATIEDRTAKGYGIVSDILAILDEIPLGSYRLDMGLKLRQAKLINGILFSSEAWHGLCEDDIKALERVDEALLRALIQAHPKIPLEFLYLETGAVRIKHIISSRRMIYLQTLLKRDDEEITKRILREQERNPCAGDYIMLVKDDFTRLEMVYDENYIIRSGTRYKEHVKQRNREFAFKELKNIQIKHSKVKDIKYETYEAQPYIHNSLFSNDEICLLAALRSHTVRGIRSNFKNLYKPNLSCPLKCQPAGSPQLEDSQEHLLSCSKLKLVHNNMLVISKVAHDDIYGEVDKQKAAVMVFSELLDQRNKLMEEA